MLYVTYWIANREIYWNFKKTNLATAQNNRRPPLWFIARCGGSCLCCLAGDPPQIGWMARNLSPVIEYFSLYLCFSFHFVCLSFTPSQNNRKSADKLSDGKNRIWGARLKIEIFNREICVCALLVTNSICAKWSAKRRKIWWICKGIYVEWRDVPCMKWWAVCWKYFRPCF